MVVLPDEPRARLGGLLEADRLRAVERQRRGACRRDDVASWSSDAASPSRATPSSTPSGGGRRSVTSAAGPSTSAAAHPHE